MSKRAHRPHHDIKVETYGKKVLGSPAVVIKSKLRGTSGKDAGMRVVSKRGLNISHIKRITANGKTVFLNGAWL